MRGPLCLPLYPFFLLFPPPCTVHSAHTSKRSAALPPSTLSPTCACCIPVPVPVSGTRRAVDSTEWRRRQEQEARRSQRHHHRPPHLARVGKARVLAWSLTRARPCWPPPATARWRARLRPARRHRSRTRAYGQPASSLAGRPTCDERRSTAGFDSPLLSSSPSPRPDTARPPAASTTTIDD